MAIEEGAAGRLEGEHAAGAGHAGWAEDVRVDPERQREILRPQEGPHARGAFGGHPADVRQPENVDDAGEYPESGGYTFVDRRAAGDLAEAREAAARTSTPQAPGEGAWSTPIAAGAPSAASSAAPASTPGAASGGATTPAGSAPQREPEGVVRALVRGAVAGAIGALAMSLTHRASSKVLLGSADAAPNPAKGAAEALGERAGVTLGDRQADAGGTALMVGYGALLGAVYGVVHDRVRSPALVNALALGGLSYAATVPEKGLLPRLGLVAPPTEQAVLAAMVPMDAHLAYGVATAAAYEAMS